MRTLPTLLSVLVTATLTFSCASSPKSADSTTPTPAADGSYTGGTGIPNPTPAPSATATPETATAAQSTPPEDTTGEDFVPDFTGFTFNTYPLQNIRPRIVEITVETRRDLSMRASNKIKIELAVRDALEAALQKSKIQVVSRSSNKINFEIKDCRNTGDSAECIAIDAVFRSPRFELEVGGYSHNGYSAKNGDRSRLSGDLTRAYHGAINAVIERLNKQLEIVGQNQ